MFVPLVDPRLRLVLLPGVRGSGAWLDRAPPSETLVPRALPFAGMPDVTCGLLMASRCAPVNYESRTACSDRRSDESPLSGKYRFGRYSGNLSAGVRSRGPPGPPGTQVRRATASAAASKMMAQDVERRARSSGSS